MENDAHDLLAPPREDEIYIAVENSEGDQFFAVGPKLLFSTSSISLSADDLNVDDKAALQEAASDVNDDPEPKTKTMNDDTNDNSDTEFHPKSNKESDISQWKGFIRKLRKGPTMHLHPSIPHLPSIKRLSRKRTNRNTQRLPSLAPHIEADLYYCFEASWKNFSLSDLQIATDNFNKENLIGEGGYSEVYKGLLEDGQLVAIKRLIRGTPEEMTSDYLSELGILVHVNHPNIASVIGYGVEGGMHLVLPLSPNGSLQSLLKGNREDLTWSSRYNIALGIASGLAYLHEGCQRRIIHRDIKSANILLTEDFEPQISDFGLAKWLPDQWSHLTVSQYEGTFGYLPPEFFMHGTVDEKTDVYAFGVLLLEVTSGRPAIDESHNSLVMWAKPLLLNKNMEDLVDPKLDGTYDLDQWNRVVMVASLCIHQNPSDRPQMSQVVRMLKGDEGILQSKTKFQKRPALKRSYPLEVIEEEETNSNERQHRVECELEEENINVAEAN